MLLCFAAENRESYCSGCMKVGTCVWAVEFFHFGFGADDFPFNFKFRFKKCFKLVVFTLWRRDLPVLELQFV